MRLACIQSNVVFANPAANAAKAIAEMERLKAEGVDLAVFPEAFLTGYCVECLEDAQSLARAGDGQGVENALRQIDEAANRLDMLVIIGYAEDTPNGLLNTAALIEPRQARRTYSKTHLPELGYDKFVQPGNDLPVFDTRLGKIGMIICYDLRPPEAARVLALKGADLIVLPTNWPEGAEISADIISISRAVENRVALATCNRVGTENGFTFIGKSKIITHVGQVLAAAGSGEETIVADLDLSLSRDKRIRTIPGKYEMEIFESRRPDLYQVLTDKP